MTESLESKLRSATERAYEIGDNCHYRDVPTCDCPWCFHQRQRPLTIEWSPLFPDTWVYCGEYDTLLVKIDGRYYLVEDPEVESVLGDRVKDPFHSFDDATSWLKIDLR